MPVRVRRLDEAASDDILDAMCAHERIALVAELSRRMWELTRRPVPRYERSDMPIRVIRR